MGNQSMKKKYSHNKKHVLQGSFDINLIFSVHWLKFPFHKYWRKE